MYYTNHVSLFQEFFIYPLSFLYFICLYCRNVTRYGWSYTSKESWAGMPLICPCYHLSPHNKLLNTNTLIRACLLNQDDHYALYEQNLSRDLRKSTFKFALIKEYVRTYMLSTTIMHIFQLNKQQVRQNSISSATDRQQKILIKFTVYNKANYLKAKYYMIYVHLSDPNSKFKPK